MTQQNDSTAPAPQFPGDDCKESGCVLISGHEGLHWNAREGGYRTKCEHAEVTGISVKEKAEIKQEHRDLVQRIDELFTIHWHEQTVVAQLLADYAAKVRLDEAKKWNVRLNPYESMDHEYHAGFNPRCGLCRDEHIAELERSAKL